MDNDDLQVQVVSQCVPPEFQGDTMIDSERDAVYFQPPESLNSERNPWENLFLLASAATELGRKQRAESHLQKLRKVTARLRDRKPPRLPSLKQQQARVLSSTQRLTRRMKREKRKVKEKRCILLPRFKSRATFGEESRLRLIQRDILNLFIREAKPLRERAIRDALGDSPDTSKALRRMCTSDILLRSNPGGKKAPFEYRLEKTPDELSKIRKLLETNQ